MLWKFMFWPIVWIVVFLPGWIWQLSLDGFIRLAAFIAGLVLFAAAMMLTAIGGRTLKYFAHQDGHKTFWPDRFTQTGIYGCMRHPMHLGLALLPVAVALMWGSLPVILTSGWGVAAALWFVLVIEEKETLRRFGNEYMHYMQQTPPFSLLPKCIRKGYTAIKQGG